MNGVQVDKQKIAKEVSERLNGLLAEDKLFQARDEWEQAVEQHGLELLEEVKNSELFIDMERKVVTAKKLLSELSDNSSWTLLRSSGGCDTFYRGEPEIAQMSFKCTKIVEKPMMHLLPVLVEVDLYQEWFPMMKRSVEVAEVSRSRKICFLDVSQPWPMSDREILIDAYGIDLTEEGGILINIRSIDEHPTIELPPVAQGAVRGWIHFGGFLLQAVEDDKTRVSLMICLNPQVPMVPQRLINFVTGRLIHVLLAEVEKQAKIDGIYGTRIIEKPHIYEYAKTIIERALQKKRNEANNIEN